MLSKMARWSFFGSMSKILPRFVSKLADFPSSLPLVDQSTKNDKIVPNNNQTTLKMSHTYENH